MLTTRRTFLGGMAAASVPVAILSAPEPVMTPHERADFHAKELAAAMAEISPNRKWRTAVDEKHFFALVVGDPIETEGGAA
ncbi:hypothetical protein ASE37_21870 [Rhizobium sp. Root268]|nr:hypothetical protein ASC86_23300 [Rhizobium sp. Root1212]KRD35171.1 hypothetical protein ASE37_21870 [Rhizobium sp. Root268]